jgi:short-subunit dehydrogenase
MKDFKNKVVAITGAGSGMGRAYALEFAKLGAKLALTDWNEENLLETRDMAQELGVTDIFTKAFDVSVEAEVFAFAKEVKAALGNTHVIINNAGLAGEGGPFIYGDAKVFQKVLDVNINGVIHGCRAFLPQLVENNEGAVVNVSSVASLVASPGGVAYNTSKFAVRGFTETLMTEFHKSPISIHNVMPGKIKTAIADGFESDAYKKTLVTPPEDVVRDVIKGIKKGKSNILTGDMASAINMLSKLPLKMRIKILWRESVEKMGVQHKYRPFNSLMKSWAEDRGRESGER